MACIDCEFNLHKDSVRGLILESKASIRRYLKVVPLTPDEKVIVEQNDEIRTSTRQIHRLKKQ